MSINRVAVKPDILRWARDRSRLDLAYFDKRFPRLQQWERGEARPTLKQLEGFAKATHTPIGFLFLPEPPEERLPIRDLRTVEHGSARPSPDLLDTIYAMQRRQDWLREERLECEAGALEFVGSARLIDDPAAVGREMRRITGLADGWASAVSTWEGAVGELRGLIEQLGVMTIVNGVVGNNSHRKLNVDEFRGFALTDPYAPLIFVNGADAKSAQMFTLAHELAHVWLGPEGEGVSGFDGIFPGDARVEKFCDQAAAEFLVPARELKELWGDVKGEPKPFEQLARRFKVSPIVIGRRAMDLRLVVGARFATSVIGAAIEGRLSFKNAYDLTGLRGGAFQEYARRLGMDLP